MRGVVISLAVAPTGARLTFCANFNFEILFISLQGMSLRLCEIGLCGFLNKQSRLQIITRRSFHTNWEEEASRLIVAPLFIDLMIPFRQSRSELAERPMPSSS